MANMGNIEADCDDDLEKFSLKFQDAPVIFNFRSTKGLETILANRPAPP